MESNKQPRQAQTRLKMKTNKQQSGREPARVAGLTMKTKKQQSRPEPTGRKMATNKQHSRRTPTGLKMKLKKKKEKTHKGTNKSYRTEDVN
jgi:hypothetical protein